MTVDWGPVAGATAYNLYWATTTGVSQASGNLIPGVSAPYIHTGRTNGTTHFYVVTALNSVIGYELGAKIAKTAYLEKRPVIEVALELTDLDEVELKRLLDPALLTRS